MNKMHDKNGEYAFLPKILRDFHDQKKLFKAIFTDVDYNEHMKNSEHDKINWIQMHVNTTDIFLFQMAKRGYTLQRDKRFEDCELFGLSKDLK